MVAHSFERIGTLADGKTSIFYSSPRRIKLCNESPEQYIKNISEHLKESLPNPWIWIFDGKDMPPGSMVGASTGRRIADIIQNEYATTLQIIYVVNPTTPMRLLLGAIRPFLKKEANARIYMCSLGLIEVVNKLQGAGVTKDDLARIMKLLQ
jgi:hypothetical protein